MALIDRVGRFPLQPVEVTPEWLTEQLRVAGIAGPDERVVGFDATPVGEGVGMLGVLARLELRWEGGAPLGSVVVKCATTTEANRAVAMGFRCYEREVRFFKELRNSLSQGVPACYAAEIDLETGDFILVLEDLVGYRLGDQATGCGIEDAELGLRLVAPLHAAWWGHADGAELEWVPRIDGDMQVTGMQAGCEAGWGPMVAQFGSVMPEEVVAAGPAYLAALPELHRRMAQAPQTLVHGDFRLDNLMFGVEPGHHPLVMLDWQGMIVSKGVHDVAYLLTQNLRTGDRRSHERELLASYHSQLVGCGVEGYSAEQCWEDYRLAALWIFEYAIVIAGTMDPGNERGRLFMTKLVERSAATIADLGLLELLP